MAKKPAAPAEKPWPADKVERRAVETLVPYARNARTQSPEQVDQIAASIREWGWTTAVLIDETGQIIAGHGRILAAQKLGLKTIPVMVADGWTEAQKRAYVLADNKLALNAGWQGDLLKMELLDLEHQNYDLHLMGWNDAELANLFAPIGGMTDPTEEWQGMPEFEQNDKRAFKSVALHFKDQDAIDRFAEIIGQSITPNTRFIWFPETEIETYADKEYAA